MSTASSLTPQAGQHDTHPAIKPLSCEQRDQIREYLWKVMIPIGSVIAGVFGILGFSLHSCIEGVGMKQVLGPAVDQITQASNEAGKSKGISEQLLVQMREDATNVNKLLIESNKMLAELTALKAQYVELNNNLKQGQIPEAAAKQIVEDYLNKSDSLQQIKKAVASDFEKSLNDLRSLTEPLKGVIYEDGGKLHFKHVYLKKNTKDTQYMSVMPDGVRSYDGKNPHKTWP